jgi:hypothetical protein
MQSKQVGLLLPLRAGEKGDGPFSVVSGCPRISPGPNFTFTDWDTSQDKKKKRNQSS